MQPSEQIKAYLLWLRERGLHIPVFNVSSSLEESTTDTEVLRDQKNSIKVVFLSDLPLEESAQIDSISTDSEQRKLLDRMIMAMQLRPEEYLITAIFTEDFQFHHLYSKDYLEMRRKELKDLIKKQAPHLVITLGQQAVKIAFDDDRDFLGRRGKIVPSPQLDGLAVLATLHPRDLLRFPGNKRLAWDDLQTGMHHLDSVS